MHQSCLTLIFRVRCGRKLQKLEFNGHKIFVGLRNCGHKMQQCKNNLLRAEKEPSQLLACGIACWHPSHISCFASQRPTCESTKPGARKEKMLCLRVSNLC